MASAPDYREFLHHTVDPAKTMFWVPSLTPAHVCRRILVFRDYDGDIFAMFLFIVALMEYFQH